MNRFRPNGRYRLALVAEQMAIVADARRDRKWARYYRGEAERTRARIEQVCAPTYRDGLEEGLNRGLAVAAATGATLLGLGAL